MAGGRDSETILKVFKSACLSYNPSNVQYRNHTISRTALIGMRRDIVEKIAGILTECDLFTQNSAFPRRYFDDLMLEQKMAF
jgi:hypothetical protein